MPKCSTTEEFITKAKKVHGDKYDYSRVKYVTSQIKVLIGCPLHGFAEQKPNNHLSQGGCRLCGVEAKKLTQDEFLSKALVRHGNRYTYERAKYIDSYQKVTVTCEVHGDYNITPSAHLHGKGCRLCAANAPLTKDEFVEKAVLTHGNKYSYEKVEYTSQNKKVLITCPDHGDFSQAASSHLVGRGCPDCAVCGYKPNKSGAIYILSSEDVVKVGITNRSVKSRLSEINAESASVFSEDISIRFKDGRIPPAIESVLLKELRSNYENPSEQHDGYTECFIGADKSLLLRRIVEIYEEVLQT